MIVKYAKDWGYKGEGKDPDLTLGKEYIVLRLIFRFREDMERVISIQGDESETPILLELKFFDVIDNRISEGWVCNEYEDGRYNYIEPQEFGGDFWEEFHDGNPEAEEIFDDVMKRLHEFHGCAYIPPKRD